MTRSFRTTATMIMTLLFILPAILTAAQPFDPCSLLTPAEIQAIVGKPVQAGKLKAQANPVSGADCNYIIDGFGSFNVLVRPLQTYDTLDRIKAAFAKMNMKPTDLPGVGDASFFTSPGFEMVQLHTFKGGKYILFTILVPGLKEAAVRPMAEKLMRTVVTRIK